MLDKYKSHLNFSFDIIGQTRLTGITGNFLIADAFVFTFYAVSARCRRHLNNIKGTGETRWRNPPRRILWHLCEPSPTASPQHPQSNSQLWPPKSQPQSGTARIFYVSIPKPLSHPTKLQPLPTASKPLSLPFCRIVPSKDDGPLWS